MKKENYQALLMLLICFCIAGCSHSDTNFFVDENSGAEFRFKGERDLVIMSTRIVTTGLTPEQTGQVVHHFDNDTRSAFLLCKDFDTTYCADIQLERYYGVAPYDVVNFYFSRDEIEEANKLIINDPIICAQKIELDINKLKL